MTTNSPFSDIDDKVKISNVLDKAALTKLSLVDDPPPVAGMGELRGSLARSIQPQFIYVSGSPFQLYPFLRDATGPVALKAPTTQMNALLRPLLAFRRINSEFLTTRKFPPLPKSISLGELNAFDLISEQHVLPLGT